MPRPLDPKVKEHLHRVVEEAVWALPDGVFADFDGDEAWRDAAMGKPEVKALLDRAVMDAVTRQG